MEAFVLKELQEHAAIRVYLKHTCACWWKQACSSEHCSIIPPLLLLPPPPLCCTDVGLFSSTFSPPPQPWNTEEEEDYLELLNVSVHKFIMTRRCSAITKTSVPTRLLLRLGKSSPEWGGAPHPPRCPNNLNPETRSSFALLDHWDTQSEERDDKCLKVHSVCMKFISRDIRCWKRCLGGGVCVQVPVWMEVVQLLSQSAGARNAVTPLEEDQWQRSRGKGDVRDDRGG